MLKNLLSKLNPHSASDRQKLNEIAERDRKQRLKASPKGQRQELEDLRNYKELSELRQFKESQQIAEQFPQVAAIAPNVTKAQFATLPIEARNLLADVAKNTVIRCEEIQNQIAQMQAEQPARLASAKAAASDLILEVARMGDTSKFID